MSQSIPLLSLSDSRMTQPDKSNTTQLCSLIQSLNWLKCQMEGQYRCSGSVRLVEMTGYNFLNKHNSVAILSFKIPPAPSRVFPLGQAPAVIGSTCCLPLLSGQINGEVTDTSEGRSVVRCVLIIQHPHRLLARDWCVPLWQAKELNGAVS